MNYQQVAVRSPTKTIATGITQHGSVDANFIGGSSLAARQVKRKLSKQQG
jgi:hypothetical protein